MPLTRSFQVFEDPELRIVHSRRSCPAAKIAVKYNYLVMVNATTIEDARALDARATPCTVCIKHERELRSKRTLNHVSPPGFRS